MVMVEEEEWDMLTIEEDVWDIFTIEDDVWDIFTNEKDISAIHAGNRTNTLFTNEQIEHGVHMIREPQSREREPHCDKS